MKHYLFFQCQRKKSWYLLGVKIGIYQLLSRITGLKKLLTCFVFCAIISHDKIKLILCFLYLAFNSTRVHEGQPWFDRLYKLSEVHETMLVPPRSFRITEQIVSKKKRHSFIQYRPGCV